MGVTGLWRLIEPAGKEVSLDSLEGKVLAVDANLLLNQAVKGFKNNPNAHLHVLFIRLCKLLTYRIKPIFVFDGGAPAIKKQTLANRQRKRDEAAEQANSVSERLRRTAVHQHAIDAMLGKPSLSQPKTENSQKDMFELPSLDAPMDVEEDDYLDMPIHDIMYSQGFDITSIDVNSEDFLSLPPEYQHEILEELKLHTKHQVSEQNIDTIKTADDFSQFQLGKILKSNKLTQKIESLRKDMLATVSQHATTDGSQVLQASRVMSEDNTRYLLLKRPASQMSSAMTKPAPTTETKRGREMVPAQGLSRESNRINQSNVRLEDITEEDEGLQQAILESQGLTKTNNPINHSNEKLEDITEADDEDIQKAILESCKSINTPPTVESFSNPTASPARSGRTHVVVLSEDESDDDVCNIKHSVRCGEGLPAGHRDSSETKQPFSDSLLPIDLTAASELEDATIPKKVREVGPCDQPTPVHPNLSGENLQSVSSTNKEQSGLSGLIGVMKTSGAEEFLSTAQLDPELIEAQRIETNKGRTNTVTDSSTLAKDIVETAIPIFDIKEANNLDDKSVSQKLNDSPITIMLHPEAETAHLFPGEMFKSAPNDSGPDVVDVILHQDKNETSFALSSERTTLYGELHRHEAVSQTLSKQMIEDSQELLTLFGVPYIVSPGEAEAQCAKLDELGLADGVITDDSDVWLFGSSRVLKNFFQKDKFVLSFHKDDIRRMFGLDREKLIAVALVCGSDYTEGIKGTGPVGALEIIAEFDSTSGIMALKKFKEWLSTVKNGFMPESISNTALKDKLKKLTLPSESFPNPVVVEAYMKPSVDSSTESFEWSNPDLDLLRSFASTKMGWTTQKVDDLLCPLLKRLQTKTYQPTLNAFFSHKTSINISPQFHSKRLKTAIAKIMDSCDASVSAPSGSKTSNVKRESKAVSKRSGKQQRRKTTKKLSVRRKSLPKAHSKCGHPSDTTRVITTDAKLSASSSDSE